MRCRLKELNPLVLGLAHCVTDLSSLSTVKLEDTNYNIHIQFIFISSQLYSSFSVSPHVYSS